MARTITRLTDARLLHAKLVEDILKHRIQTRRLLNSQERVELVEVENIHVLFEERARIIIVFNKKSKQYRGT